MKLGIDDLVQDQRPISGIFWGEENHQCYVVGHGGVTKIEAYYENGEYAGIPWFAVYVGDELIARRCAGGCRVDYHIEGTGP